MGRQRKRKPSGATSPRPAPKQSPLPLVAALGVTVVVALALWMWRTPGPDLQQVVGRWQRTDAAYVLELRHLDGEGRLEASYFNPRSIHVARATASREGTVVNVFVELRDVNYPGSTYTLAYDPASDQLKGTYFQAVQQVRFPVVFSRQR